MGYLVLPQLQSQYACALSNDRYGTIHCVSFDSPNQT